MRAVLEILANYFCISIWSRNVRLPKGGSWKMEIMSIRLFLNFSSAFNNGGHFFHSASARRLGGFRNVAVTFAVQDNNNFGARSTTPRTKSNKTIDKPWD